MGTLYEGGQVVKSHALAIGYYTPYLSIQSLMVFMFRVKLFPHWAYTIICYTEKVIRIYLLETQIPFNSAESLYKSLNLLIPNDIIHRFIPIKTFLILKRQRQRLKQAGNWMSLDQSLAFQYDPLALTALSIQFDNAFTIIFDTMNS